MIHTRLTCFAELTGDVMNDRTVDTSLSEDVWGNRTKAGMKRIKKDWIRLQPQTRRLFTEDGFDDRGGRSAPLESWDETGNLVYAIGYFEEAAKASIPAKNGDSIPACYEGHELLNEAVELVLNPQYCDPEFTRLALHACMKQQASSAVVSFYYNGGSRTKAIGGVGKVIWSVALSIAFATSLGNGLVMALNHDASSASVCAFIAMFCYGYLKNMSRPEEESKWEVAYTHWSALIFRDFHLGTAHGVEKKLQQLERQGIHIHSVLFDLCATVQQGMDLSRRVHITTTRKSA